MNGIEKITGRIGVDAQAEIDGLTAAARAQAETIAAEGDAQAHVQAEEILRRGQLNAAQREERLASVAGLEGRKTVLAAKQDMVGRTFDRALERLCTLDETAYVDLLAALSVKAARTGHEQVIFSQKDRNRVGKAVVTRANELLADKGMLTLAEGTRPIKGGVVLSDGDVETNCSFEVLVRLQRDDMAATVAQALFEA